MADSTSVNAAFDTWLRGEVRSLLVAGVSDFPTLIDKLPSVYPAIVISTLRHLKGEDNSDDQIVSILQSASDAPRSDLTGKSTNVLLPPHPLDYEWRFANTAIERITSELQKSTPERGSIALVATPSIGAELNSRDLGRQCVYFGRDAQEVKIASRGDSILKWETIDLSKEQRIRTLFDTIVMDPPWYPEYMDRFLWYSAQLCRLGGTLLLSMPGQGTRPGMMEELLSYRAYWEMLGFVEEGKVAQFLPYYSPTFERNSLRAAGITNVSTMWRKGDLVRLRRIRDSSIPWPGNLSDESWQEFVFGRVRIRVNAGALSNGTDPRLIPLAADTDNVLPTVSRRDPTRSQVRVWTTGNRVFGCEAPSALIKCLEQFGSILDNGYRKTELREPPRFYGSDREQELKKQIEMIVNLESVELKDASQG